MEILNGVEPIQTVMKVSPYQLIEKRDYTVAGEKRVHLH